MAILPTQLARVSNLLRTNVAHQTISRTQQNLLQVQNELSTGKRLNVPSDDPGAAAAAQQLHKLLEQRLAFASNLRHAGVHLAETDSALADMTDLLQQAQTIASANVGSDVTADQRSAAAEIVKSLYSQMLALANRQLQGVYLFGGDRSTDAPFVEEGGQVRFVGSSEMLYNRVDENTYLPFMVDGNEVFGALSTRVQGRAVGEEITPLTPLAELNGGAGIDLSGGLIITNGAASATIDLASAATVEDLLNAINGSGTGVRAQINAAATGIDILNPVQGSAMSIAENGGTTAADLGVRTFRLDSPLSELNFGKGVRTAEGTDLRITRSDGTSFDVDLSGLVTAAEVIDAINAADGGGGVAASFAATGNGIVLTDSVGGLGSLSITPLNFSQAAADLGLLQPAAGGAIAGADVNRVRPEGVLAHLQRLIDALQSSDAAGITEAAEGLRADHERIVRIRGATGARVQEIEARQYRLEEQNLAARALLSELEDSDYTEAIMRFQMLQQSLQASLQTSARMMNLSLLDFLG